VSDMKTPAKRKNNAGDGTLIELREVGGIASFRLRINVPAGKPVVDSRSSRRCSSFSGSSFSGSSSGSTSGGSSSSSGGISESAVCTAGTIVYRGTAVYDYVLTNLRSSAKAKRISMIPENDSHKVSLLKNLENPHNSYCFVADKVYFILEAVQEALLSFATMEAASKFHQQWSLIATKGQTPSPARRMKEAVSRIAENDKKTFVEAIFAAISIFVGGDEGLLQRQKRADGKDELELHDEPGLALVCPPSPTISELQALFEDLPQTPLAEELDLGEPPLNTKIQSIVDIMLDDFPSFASYILHSLASHPESSIWNGIKDILLACSHRERSEFMHTVVRRHCALSHKGTEEVADLSREIGSKMGGYPCRDGSFRFFPNSHDSVHVSEYVHLDDVSDDDDEDADADYQRLVGMCQRHGPFKIGLGDDKSVKFSVGVTVPIPELLSLVLEDPKWVQVVVSQAMLREKGNDGYRPVYLIGGVDHAEITSGMH
jgi:hypothetical protein